MWLSESIDVFCNEYSLLLVFALVLRVTYLLHHSITIFANTFLQYFLFCYSRFCKNFVAVDSEFSKKVV